MWDGTVPGGGLTTARDARREHERCVDLWLTSAVERDSSTVLARLMFRATDALYARAVLTLGSVTLSAIVSRVMLRAETRYPFAASGYGKSPARRAELEQVANLPASRMLDGMRFVLVELLDVLGRLTADILTPELHAALLETAPAHATEVATGERWQPVTQIAKDAS
ncbi:MAG: hypothetical protein WKG01_22510 [Kofleriaceae bacterium]